MPEPQTGVGTRHQEDVDHESFNLFETAGVEMSAEARPQSRQSHIRAHQVEMSQITNLRVPLLQIAWLFGIGLVGFAVDGVLGAGGALMLPASSVFVGALILSGDSEVGRGQSKRRTTLRHGYFLWLDQRRQKRERKRRERRERQTAERDFLERRKRRGR